MAQASARPVSVRRGCALAGIGAATCCLVSLYGIAQLDSAELRAEVQRQLDSWTFVETLDTAEVLTLMRWTSSTTALLAVPVLVFSVYAHRGHQPSRLALTVLAPVLVLAGLVSGWALFPALLAATGTVLLWLPASRAWFAAVSGGSPPAPASAAPRGVAVSHPPPPGPNPDQPSQQPSQPPSQPPGYGQPPSYGQPQGDRGGQPPPGQPYSQQPYQQQYGQHDQPSPYPRRRPGGVTAAAVIAIVMSVLTGGFWVVVGLFMVAGGDAIIDAVRDDSTSRQQLEDAGVTLTELEDGLGGFGIGAIVVGVLFLLAILPAIGVLRGSNAARIILVALSVLTVLIGVVFAFGGGLGIPWAIAGIVVIVLLFVGDASSWFAGKKARAV